MAEHFPQGVVQPNCGWFPSGIRDLCVEGRIAKVRAVRDSRGFAAMETSILACCRAMRVMAEEYPDAAALLQDGRFRDIRRAMQPVPDVRWSQVSPILLHRAWRWSEDAGDLVSALRGCFAMKPPPDLTVAHTVLRMDDRRRGLTTQSPHAVFVTPRHCATVDSRLTCGQRASWGAAISPVAPSGLSVPFPPAPDLAPQTNATSDA